MAPDGMTNDHFEMKIFWGPEKGREREFQQLTKTLFPIILLLFALG
jgi:hypothetical protein